MGSCRNKLHYTLLLQNNQLFMKNRKTFISYHYNDITYYQKFASLSKGFIVNKSVKDGAIKEDSHDQYIKELIQRGNLKDTSVLVVLIGAKTYSRKHVDWEISGALNKSVGDIYAGLLGIRLPTHPDYNKNGYNSNNIPARLVDNLESGYAQIYDWTANKKDIEDWVHRTYYRRTSHATQRVNNRGQMI